MDDVAALRLQIAWGADEALVDAPVDRRYAGGAAKARPAANVVPTPITVVVEAPAAAAGGAEPAAVARAVGLAASAPTLSALRDAIAGFDGCPLRETAMHTVFAEGEPTAALAVIGDAPGADDDRSGKFFSGAVGAYLDRMLASIGLDRARILLVPLIPWRPPGGRPPSERELAVCMPFLFRYVELCEATLLVSLGMAAARCLLGRPTPRRRPGFVDLTLPNGGRGVSMLTTASPEQLIQRPQLRAAAWVDLRSLRRKIDQLAIKS